MEKYKYIGRKIIKSKIYDIGIPMPSSIIYNVFMLLSIKKCKFRKMCKRQNR